MQHRSHFIYWSIANKSKPINSVPTLNCVVWPTDVSHYLIRSDRSTSVQDNGRIHKTHTHTHTMLENVMPSTIWLLSLPAIRHSHLPYRTSSNESSPDCGSMSGNGICARRDKNVLHASICIIVSIINGILDHGA